MKARQQNAWVSQSPWLDPAKPNLYRYEFQLAQEYTDESYLKPLEPYQWIYKNNGEQLFLRCLAKLAPMFPLRSYGGQVAIWTSPPPSGSGNAIYIVMGTDNKGQLRAVGGNYFTEPRLQRGEALESESFFESYDQLSERNKQQLVRETVIKSITPKDKELLANVIRECEHFHTMPIYITVLTKTGSLFHVGKAVIEGFRPSDFSYEFFGEII